MKLGLSAKFLFLILQAKLIRNNKRKYKDEQKFESKEEYFIKNGGILLEKQIALSQGQHKGGQLMILSEAEMKKATNNYDPDLIVGRARGGTVYKGTFDDRTVAIKTAQESDPNPGLVDLFLTDVSIGTVISHNNMVRIYGCCLETCVPMMVYEFYPSKSLFQCLHGDMAREKPLKWRVRLKIAIDISYALSYMHNALSKVVVHRDVMSSGILLDSSFHAKVAGLGHCVAITPGKKDQRWPVHGALGYVDPEYIETREVTEKCDVYSFGVLMLELLTARDPMELAKCGRDLVDEYVSAVKINGVVEMIDKILLEEANMIDDIQMFSRLALTCVAKKGEERPTMISVVEELWLIHDQVNKKSET